MKKIAVLITCFNRCRITLSCLDSLAKVDIPSGFSLDVFLVDDASPDNTAKEVIGKYPRVNVIKGNGDLYWNRGMYTAWNEAYKTFDYDFYLWLNDDTLLHENALENLLETSKKVELNSIIVGTICSMNDLESITYGGRNRNGIIIPNGISKICDNFNGNCVLIPKIVFKTIGNLDYYFKHSFGDFEYGLRSRIKGFNSYVTPSPIGKCDRNQWPPNYLKSEITLFKRFKFLYSPLGFNPIESFYFNFKYKSPFYTIIVFLKLHLNVLFPIIVLKK